MHENFNLRALILVSGAIDIVTKDFPASIECKRTKQQRQDERVQALTDKLVVICIQLAVV